MAHDKVLLMRVSAERDGVLLTPPSRLEKMRKRGRWRGRSRHEWHVSSVESPCWTATELSTIRLNIHSLCEQRAECFSHEGTPQRYLKSLRAGAASGMVINTLFTYTSCCLLLWLSPIISTLLRRHFLYSVIWQLEVTFSEVFQVAYLDIITGRCLKRKSYMFSIRETQNKSPFIVFICQQREREHSAQSSVAIFC